MKTVLLKTCVNAIQAHILQGALANEGIESMLQDENISTVLSNMPGFETRILVFEDDYERALKILEENEHSPLAEE